MARGCGILAAVRVYVASTLSGLTRLLSAGALPVPAGSTLTAHGVTRELWTASPEAEEDELEYTALMAAAYDSLVLIADTPGEQPARVVIVAEVPDRAVGRVVDVTSEVTVDGDVPLSRISAIHVDELTAADAVRAAAALVPAAQQGDVAALDAVELEDYELLWYATQEIADLLAARD
jgi:hypothetical protein